tara:strand:- start:53 stop:385 length:333 start_codon:yes stop_codon:yes gene_type:complete
MDIVKSNKNIARYMGWKYKNQAKYWIIYPYDDNSVFNNHTRTHSVKNLKFNKSWDWLIPVINKITSDDMYSKYVDYSSSMIDDGGIYINTKFIDVTYNNVVDFINWYNNQ